MMERVQELCRKLKPVMGSKIDRLWSAYLAESDTDGKADIEQTLELLAAKHLGTDYQPDRAPFPPPEKAVSMSGDVRLGSVSYGSRELYPFYLKSGRLKEHLLIAGRSGSGKTNLTFVLMQGIMDRGIKVLALDWKRGYRDLVTSREDLLVYTIGREVSPFRFNPLIPPPGCETHVWIKLIVDVIANAYLGGEGVISLLVAGLDHLFRVMGVFDHTQERWPTVADLLAWLRTTKLKGRAALWKDSAERILLGMTYSEFGAVINCQDNGMVQGLLDHNVVLEMDEGPPIGPDEARAQAAEREHLVAAMGLLRDLVEKHPADPRFRHLLALCYLEGGPAEPQEQTGTLEQAIAVLEALAKDFPEAPQYRFDLCEAFARVHVPPPPEPPPHAGPSRKTGPPTRPPADAVVAEEWLRKALGISQELTARHPYIPQYSASEARILHKLGSLLRQTGRLEEAERHCRKAVALQSDLAPQFPELLSHRIWLAEFQTALGDVLARGGKPQEARSWLEKALGGLNGLPKDDPGPWFVPALTARGQSALARALRELGEPQAAREAERQAEESLLEMRRRSTDARSKQVSSD